MEYTVSLLLSCSETACCLNSGFNWFRNIVNCADKSYIKILLHEVMDSIVHIKLCSQNYSCSSSSNKQSLNNENNKTTKNLTTFTTKNVQNKLTICFDKLSTENVSFRFLTESISIICDRTPAYPGIAKTWAFCKSLK